MKHHSISYFPLRYNFPSFYPLSFSFFATFLVFSDFLPYSTLGLNVFISLFRYRHSSFAFLLSFLSFFIHSLRSDIILFVHRVCAIHSIRFFILRFLIRSVGRFELPLIFPHIHTPTLRQRYRQKLMHIDKLFAILFVSFLFIFFLSSFDITLMMWHTYMHVACCNV